MDALALAKRRAGRRRDAGGAVMFVVAMTIAVLASVGIYALAAAATEVKTSGNERQNTQTHYLAEYGILGVSREMAASKADFYVKLMQKNPDTCFSLPGVPATASPITKACRRLPSSELAANWAAPTVNSYAGSAPYANGATPGSFGAVPMNGDFFVELTEASQAKAPPRYALNLNFCFIQMTATSVGITQPLFPNLTGATLTTYGSEGLEMQRARIVAGPVQCPR